MKKYDSYKDSGVEWIGKVPAHWGVDILNRIFKINTGFTPSTSNNEFYENGEHDWITIRDLDGKYVSESKTKLTDIAVKGKTIIPKGSLLYSFKLSVGQMAFTTKDIYTNEAIFSVFPSEKLNLNYYYYLLDRILIHNSNENIYGAKILNQELIKASKLLVPSEEEQTTIANYLDHKTTQIEHLIAKKEQFIQLLEEERIAVINQAVTKGLDPSVPLKDSGIEWLGEIPEHWEIAKIKRLSALISKGTTPSTVGKEVSDKGEIRYLKSENIVDNQLLNTPEFYIDNETNQILRRSILEINDVLIVIAGASIGKVAILTDDFYPSNTNQAVSFIRLKNPNSSCFVWYWLQSSYIKERISLDATQSAQPNLSMESIGNFYIPKISIEEEQDIMTFLTQKTKDIDVIISKTKQEIELLKEYKTAFISEVVTGKIDVRN
jgi:type I restriction enzyme S subunit